MSRLPTGCQSQHEDAVHNTASDSLPDTAHAHGKEVCRSMWQVSRVGLMYCGQLLSVVQLLSRVIHTSKLAGQTLRACAAAFCTLCCLGDWHLRFWLVGSTYVPLSTARTSKLRHCFRAFTPLQQAIRHEIKADPYKHTCCCCC